MFILEASKSSLTVRQRELMTSGSVNVNTVKFDFSADWEGLTKTAVFRAGEESHSILLDDTSQCEIPWEVLSSAEERVYAGVYGTRGQETVLPTIWTSLGVVQPGAAPDGGTYPPTPELWEQELAKKGDRLGYTEVGGLGLYAGEKLLSSVPAEGGGSGTADHRALSHRDEAGQHPISAIDGLPEALERIPGPVEPLTNSDLEEILK